VKLLSSIFIQIKAVSVANLREHWAEKAKRAKSQRTIARVKTPPYDGPPFIRVMMVRVGIRELDDDNLRTALKAYRDGVADRFRVDDASPFIKFDYAQERGDKEGVRIEIRTPTIARQEEMLGQAEIRFDARRYSGDDQDA
jgi:hypothetical protein